MRSLLLLVLLSALVTAQPASLKEAESWPEQAQIFHPERGQPDTGGLPVKELWITSQDGVRLNAWWSPPPPGGLTVLHFHGTFSNLASTHGTVIDARNAGLGVLAIDYRGYGKSSGRPSEEGVYRDARAAYAKLLKLGIKPEKLLIHGHSLGGAVAAHLAGEKPCAGLILESTFTTARAIGLRLHGKEALKMHSRFDTLGTVKNLKVPLLLIHGGLDALIPCTMGMEIYNAAPGPKELWVLPLGGHGGLNGPEYSQRLRRFAAKISR